MAQRSPNVLGLDDREEQLKIIKALRDEISELEEKERGVDVNLQELLNKQYKLIDDEQQFLTSLSNLKDELALKKIQTKSLNEEINEARKQQDNLYDQLYQYNQSIPEKTSSNEFNTDLIRNTDEESYLIEVHQLLLEQQNDIEKQIENYQHKINLYQDDLKSNEKQIEILQTSKKNLGQELEDRQRQKELKERDLSQSRNNLIERQNDRKRDEQQLRILREKSAQLDYSKTFLKELSKDKQKEVDHILKRFKDELVEIDNRRKTIADEIRTKENDMKDLKKDIERITTIDFTTSSPMSLTEEERDFQLTQYEEDIQSDLNLTECEKDQIDKTMKANQTEYADLEKKLAEIEKNIEKSETNLQECQTQLRTKQEQLRKLSVEHPNLRKTAAESAAKLRQCIEELLKIRLDLFNLLKKEKDSNQQQEDAKHSVKIAEQNLKTENEAFTLAQEAIDAVNQFVRENPEAKIVGLDTKQRMFEARKTAVKKAENDLNAQRELLQKRGKDYNTATSNRIQAEKTLEDLEKEIAIEKQNVNKCQSNLNSLEKQIEGVEKQISEILVDVEKAEQKNGELKDNRESQANQIILKKQEMEVDQHRFDFVSNNIAQYAAHLNDIKRLKEDLKTRRSEMQKQFEQFVQSKKISTKNEIRTVDLSKDANIRRIESDVFELNVEDNRLNVRKGTLERLSRAIPDKNNDLEKLFQDDKREFETIQKQIENLENKLQTTDIAIEFATKDIEAEEEKQTELERYLRTQTAELVFRQYELLNFQLNENQLKKQIELIEAQLKKRRDDSKRLKEKLIKNEDESRIVRSNIHDLQGKIDKENRSSSNIKYPKGEIELNKKRIATMNKNIEQLENEFMKIEPELNKILADLKVVYQNLCNCARKLADIQPKILEKQIQMNDCHHEAARKQDLYRNYLEQQSKFTVDAYIYFYPEPEPKTTEKK